MIALNKTLPPSCIECPCMQTYRIDNERVFNVEYLVRYCAAAKQEMVVLEWDRNKPVSKVWEEWEKPSWCPWVEMEDTHEEN